MHIKRWFNRLFSAWRHQPSVAPAAAPSSADQRSERRYYFGASAPLLLQDNQSITCNVADAGRHGLRLTLRDPLPAGVTPTVVLHFNGVFLRRPLDIVWTRKDEAGFAVGARFADADVRNPVHEHFVRYLQWKATSCRVA